MGDQGGYEYNVVLIAAALTLVEVGPGEPSLDAALGRERSGPGWALAALLAGAGGAIGAHYAAAAIAPAEDEPPAPAAATNSSPSEAEQEVPAS